MLRYIVLPYYQADSPAPPSAAADWNAPTSEFMAAALYEVLPQIELCPLLLAEFFLQMTMVTHTATTQIPINIAVFFSMFFFYLFLIRVTIASKMASVFSTMLMIATSLCEKS